MVGLNITVSLYTASNRRKDTMCIESVVRISRNERLNQVMTSCCTACSAKLMVVEASKDFRTGQSRQSRHSVSSCVVLVLR